MFKNWSHLALTIACAFVFIALVVIGQESKPKPSPELDVKWLDAPVTARRQEGGPRAGSSGMVVETGVQLGLRDDGVVVWRDKK